MHSTSWLIVFWVLVKKKNLCERSLPYICYKCHVMGRNRKYDFFCFQKYYYVITRIFKTGNFRNLYPNLYHCTNKSPVSWQVKKNIIVNCIVLLYNFPRCGLSLLSVSGIYLIEIDHDNISQNERRHDLSNDKIGIHILLRKQQKKKKERKIECNVIKSLNQ